MITGAEDLLHTVQAVAGAVVVSCCVLAFVAMSGRTRHCYRIIYGVLSVTGLAFALLPFAPSHLGMRIWLDTAFIAAAAAYLLLDRRRIGKRRPTTQGDKP